MMSLSAVTSWMVLLTAIFPYGGISLKMLRVFVPQYTIKGEPVELLCEFDLQADRLYAVSWYKDNDEFYRYVPRNDPPQHTYRVDGIKVDRPNSDAQKVTISNIPLKSSGVYRCEVSAEAPSFSSVNGQSRMDVVALPQEGPEITGEERNYRVGDEIDLNCTSAKSFPPAKLSWYVNNEPVRPHYEAVLQQHGLVTSVAGLKLQLGPAHFLNGRLQVRCVATISTEPPAHPAPQRLPSSSPPPPLQFDYNREALFSVRGGCIKLRVSLALLLTSLLLLST